MNSLFVELLRALRSYRWLRLLGCAFILSSLGNDLTQVVVFGQLLRWQASPATRLDATTTLYSVSLISLIGVAVALWRHKVEGLPPDER